MARSGGKLLALTAVCNILGLVLALRSTGIQGFVQRNKLYLDGGLYLDEASKPVPQSRTIDHIDLGKDFILGSASNGQGPDIFRQEKPSIVPDVSHGVIWSDYRTRAYLYGGAAVDGNPLNNTIWEIDTSDDVPSWSQLDVDMPDDRPSHGAGCDFYSIQKGFYLGGRISAGNLDDIQPQSYRHYLDIWDMKLKTLKTVNVPSFVPVIEQNLIPINNYDGNVFLIALGGYVHHNDTLTMAPMHSISVYDITNDKWYQQPTTGLNGSVEEDYTAVNESSNRIPQPRVRACSTFGAASDRTSQNLILLGGQNDTHMMGDVWILSMPSFLWIKILMPIGDSESIPKADASCFLINSHYLFQFGGCYNYSAEISCTSWNYDPLVYDIAIPNWSDYTSRYLGYLVPPNVSQVVGGGATGDAIHLRPEFTNFSSLRLSQLFTPPPRDGNTDYNNYSRQVQIVALVGLITIALSVAWIIVDSIFLRKSRFSQPHQWKPWAMSAPYLLFLALSGLIILVLLTVLYVDSRGPDQDASHWSGVAVSDVFWSNEDIPSRFVSETQAERPPKGVFSVYYNPETSGFWSQRNFTSRLSPAVYWTWNYLPLIVFVLYGRAWKILDTSLKSVYKYSRLTRAKGASAQSSLLLSYHSFWAPLCVFQAIRHQHWIIVLSSTNYILASIIIPVVQNYAIVWQLFANGTLKWDPWIYFWITALVEPYWYPILTTLLVLNVTLGALLVLLITRKESCLQANPGGFAWLAEAVCNTDAGNLGLPADADKLTLSKLESSIASYRYQLVPQNNPIPGPVLKLIPSSSSPSGIWSSLSNKFLVLPCPQFLRKSLEGFRKWCTDHPHFFIFRKPVFFLWLLFLLGLMVLGIYMTRKLDDSADLNYRLTVPPQMFIIIAVLVQSVMDVIEESVRLIAPYDQLRRGYQSPQVLFQDYTLSNSPLPDALLTYIDGQYLLGFTILAGYATAVYTIFIGTLQLSSSSYGATSIFQDKIAAIGSTITIAFVFGVNICIGWRYCATPWLTKPPDSLGALITSVIFSESLMEDFKAVQTSLTPKEKIDDLVRMDRRYAYGVLRYERIGIERHEHWPDSMGGNRGSTVTLEYEKGGVGEDIKESLQAAWVKLKTFWKI